MTNVFGFLEKERKKWHADVDSGKVKTGATMSKREHRKAKKMWQEKTRKYRKRKSEDSALLTPPAIPHQEVIKPPVPGRSRQYKQAVKKRKREHTKRYRRLTELEKSLQKQKRLTDVFNRSAVFGQRSGQGG